MPTGHLPELLIILVIALIVFGPQRLPEVTGSLGRAVREFRKVTADFQEHVMSPIEPDQEEPFPHVPPPADEAVEASGTLAPTIDTLAQRRARRKALAESTADATESSEPESATEVPVKPKASASRARRTASTPKPDADEAPSS